MILKRIAAVCLFFAFITTATAGEKTGKRPITLEDLWKVKRLGKPAISPDGQWVAIDVTSFNMDDNSSSTHLWLCSTDGKTQKQLTTAKGGASGATWSPDGQSIAFVSKRSGDVAQIYVISPSGGEARQVSHLPMAPTGVKWSSDAKTLYCVVQTWPDTPDDASYLKKEKAQKDSKVQAFVIDDALYRVWDHWIADGRRPVVFAVDVASGKHGNLFANTKRTLPASGGTGADYDVSPDGKEICFTSESAKELGMDFNLDLYVMPILASGGRKSPDAVPESGGLRPPLAEPKNITPDNPANDFAPLYSPDGKSIAFSRQTIKYFYADRVRIMVFDRERGNVREISAKLDRSCSSYVWQADGKHLFFEFEDKGCHRICVGADGKGLRDSEVTPVTANNSDVSPVTNKNGAKLVFQRSNFSMPAALYSMGINYKVSTEVPGILKELPVEDGGRVKKGDVIGRLHDVDAMAQRQLCLAEVQIHNTRVDMFEKLLAKEKDPSQRQVLKKAIDAAMEEEKKARLRLDAANTHRDKLILRAPRDGIVHGLPPVGSFLATKEGAFFCQIMDAPPLPIEHFNDPLRAEWDLGEVKNVTYKGADEEDVQMWIVYPPNFDAKKRWPLLMMVHGGPHNAITTDFHYRWNAHLFAAKGYVVAIPNFHGSSGFGQKFTDSITGDMATKPFIDVMKATDYMEALPYIDKTRTTAAGASYGGYMMAWLNGHTDRYKAMVCHAGVYNWHSMMASDFVRGRERPLGALPFGDQAKIDKQNPQRFAANFKTPTLVMHGEKDYRVPITQGMEYYNTLRIKGVPSRFVYFPDENHWILKPQNARLWHREFFAWLEKHVGSGPTK